MRKRTYLLLLLTVALGFVLMAHEWNLTTPWGADLLRKAPETLPPPSPAAVITPAPRPTVPRKVANGLARLVNEPGNPRLLQQVREAIKQGRNLAPLEALLRETLHRNPQHVELNELIGDLYLQEGRHKEALESFENSETGENEFRLPSKVIPLYGEIFGGEAVDKYLTRLDKNIVDGTARKNQSPDQVEAREQAALAVCKARYLRQLETSDNESIARTAFAGCKKHFAQSDPAFLKRYGTYEPDATAWARDLPRH